jgi:hypothetical protein
MRTGLRLSGCTALVLAVTCGTVRAQDAGAPSPNRARLGPIILVPTIELRDVGIDTNVYNENSVDPTKDFAFTLVPAVRASLRSPRWNLDARSSTNVLYYMQQASERSVNEDLATTVEIRLHRFTAIAEGGYVNTRERVSSEIDARARRYEWRGGGGVGLAITPKVTGRIRADVFTTTFNPQATFDDSGLAEVLNRETGTVDASLKYVLTPITSAVVSTDFSRVRFTRSPMRDTDIRQTMAGFDFNPRARITGTLRVGWQVFAPLNPAIVDFDGFVGTTSVSYRIRPSTNVGIQYERRTDFSYQPLEPYYVRQSVGLSIRQSLPHQWSVDAGLQRATHRYRPLDIVGEPPPPGHGERLFGGLVGLAHDIGPRLRVQTSLVFQLRRSDVVDRQFDNLRIGTSLAYQF